LHGRHLCGKKLEETVMVPELAALCCAPAFLRARVWRVMLVTGALVFDGVSIFNAFSTFLMDLYL
jgi:hypothetical protein